MSRLSTDDLKVLEKYANELVSQGRRFDRRLIYITLTCIPMIISGATGVYQFLHWLQPRPAILEVLDQEAKPDDVPALLYVSGQSRKGLALLELQSEMRTLDAIQATFGFVLLLIGICGLIYVYNHRSDSKKLSALGRLLHQTLNQER